jgi:dihydroorotate dehydrogenase
MSSPWSIAKHMLFRIDAENAHRFATSSILLTRKLGRKPMEWIAGAPVEGLEREVFGMKFLNPLGLAAGFDKNAELLPVLPELGFGFAEIGTVTPRAQPGNPRPRLFREPERQAIFNRMGFNNLGAPLVAERIRRVKPLLPPHFRVGVNVGKNKDTEANRAAEDFARATEPFQGLADYLVVNVSSPNTPGLRDLQNEDALRRILESVKEVVARWTVTPPILLKLAPEIEAEPLTQLMGALESSVGVDGWVLTNTLGGSYERKTGEVLPGGWSGSPLSELSRSRLRAARAATRLPVISVGGIMDEREASARLSLGADLIQIYSGWIFGGPRFPHRVLKSLKTASSIERPSF